METLPDWAALQRHVAAVSRSGKGHSTNLYVAQEQVERWCAAGELQVLCTDGAVLVLRADRDFRHVHHVAADLSALTDALRLLPAGTYTTDLIGRDDDLAPVCAAYADAGFAHHSFLRRMTRTQSPGTAGAGDIVPADPNEVRGVARLLDRLLDRFTEQLPTDDDLHAAAVAGGLLVVRRDPPEDVPAGMLMYEIKGQLAHLRFWHVDHDVRGAGVGRRLMTAFLSRCGAVRRIVLWVIGDNDRSIAIYQHYGFDDDGLLDRIMILRKD